jgi:uncharacterized membrane protein
MRTAMRHPLHPALVHLPFGLLAATSLFDALSWVLSSPVYNMVARLNLTVGLIASLPAVASGLLELGHVLRAGQSAAGGDRAGAGQSAAGGDRAGTGQSAAGGDRTGAGQSGAAGDRTGAGQSGAAGDRTGAGQSAAGGDRAGAGQSAAGGDRAGAGQSAAGGDRTTVVLMWHIGAMVSVLGLYFTSYILRSDSSNLGSAAAIGAVGLIALGFGGYTGGELVHRYGVGRTVPAAEPSSQTRDATGRAHHAPS